MKNDKEFKNVAQKLCNKELENFKKNIKNKNDYDEYLYKTCEKIFKKMVFPYFRFEILLKVIEDVYKNSEVYFGCSKFCKTKINKTKDKLGNICIYLNIALDEFYKLLKFLDYVKK